MYILDFVFTEKDTLDVWVNGDKVETFVSTYIFDTLSLMLNTCHLQRFSCLSKLR